MNLKLKAFRDAMIKKKNERRDAQEYMKGPQGQSILKELRKKVDE